MITSEKRIKKNKKETVEYSAIFLDLWNKFNLEKGLSKRKASIAAVYAFMNTGPLFREEFVERAVPYVMGTRKRLGPRVPQLGDPGLTRHEDQIKKETIEYPVAVLNTWSDFCNRKGYVKRVAAVAARMNYMELTAEQREAANSYANGVKENEST